MLLLNLLKLFLRVKLAFGLVNEVTHLRRSDHREQYLQVFGPLTNLRPKLLILVLSFCDFFNERLDHFILLLLQVF